MESFQKKLLIVFGLAFLLSFFALFFFNGFNATGNIIFEETSEGILSDSILKFSLEEGEFIPASSKVILENGGEEFIFNLKDFVSEEPSVGDYYIEGVSISGTGEGYGFKEIVNDSNFRVYFTLNIYQTDSGEEEVKNKNSGSNSGVSSGEEGDKGEVKEKENLDVEEVSSEEIVEEIEETSSQSVNLEEDVGIQDESSNKEVNLDSKSEKNSEKGEKNDEEKSSSENLESIESSSLTESSESSESSLGEVSITGGVIGMIFKSVSNFFLGLTGTQMAIKEFDSKIYGEVSYDVPFTYELEEGQFAEVLSGSVRSDLEKLSDEDINLEIKDTSLVVTTDYGFNEGGNGLNEIELDLGKLDFSLEEGDFNIKIIYGDVELGFFKTKVKKKDLKDDLEIVKNKTDSEEVKVILSDDEKEVLISKYGENFTIKGTKAEEINGRLVLRYELGDYWYEPSYELGLDKANLEFLMVNDRIFWLKDIARKLSEKELETETLEEYVKDYNFEN